MSSVALKSLFREWKELIRSEPQTSGWDSLAVRAFWEIVEHRMKCEVCRDEDIGRNIFTIPENRNP